MTENQQRALIRAYLELEKEFDHGVVIVCLKEKPGSLVQPDPIVSWFGGLITAKHLVTDALDKIARRKLTRSAPTINKEILDEIMKENKK